jgi:hypothetical protein
MLSPSEASDIAREWRPKFVDEEYFDKSWQRFFEMTGDPTSSKLENWLAKDQAKDQLVHMGVPREPLLPVQSQYRTNDCQHCGGNGYVRVDVPHTHERFGKALRCPECNGGLRSELVAPPTESTPKRTGNWCLRCGAGEEQPANENCENPQWHIPGGVSVERPATLESVLRRF